jgi:hypothetical protein
LLAAPSRRAAAACAVLAEDFPARWRGVERVGLAVGDRPVPSAPASARAAAEPERPIEPRGPEREVREPEEDLLRAVLRGFPTAWRRREPNPPRLLLSSGQGATLARRARCAKPSSWWRSRSRRAARSSAAAEALVRMASAVRREWIP